MMNVYERDRVRVGTVGLFARHWDAIDQYARKFHISSNSAALRRILDEWLRQRAAEAGTRDSVNAPD